MSTEFICEVSGRRYKTARGARESAKRERLRSYQRDYVRLNAGTAQEFIDLMVEKSKEFYGWDMELELKSSGFDYWQNQKQSTEDKVLSIEAEMLLSINKKYGGRKRICYFILGYFEGVNLSFGWNEVRYFSEKFRKVKFHLTLKNFPKLLENYEKFLEQRSANYVYLDTKHKAKNDAKNFVESRPDLQSRREEEDKILSILDKHRQKTKELVNYYTDGYMSLWECSNGSAPRVDMELSDTFS